MSTKKILQIRYRFDGPFAQFDDILPEFADRMLTVPGLEWKIWAYDESVGEGSGIYLFTDGERATAYAEPMVAEMRQLLAEVSAHLYDIHEKSTEVTLGPIG